MGCYEIKKRGLCSRGVFYDDKVVIYSHNVPEEIPVEQIDTIEYKEPSFLRWIIWLINLILCEGLVDYFPGIMTIKLTKEGGGRTFVIKPKKKEIYKLPIFYKVKMGLCEAWEENREKL